MKRRQFIYRLGVGSVTAVAGANVLQSCMKHDMSPDGQAYVSVVEPPFSQPLSIAKSVVNPANYPLVARQTLAPVIKDKNTSVLSFTSNSIANPLFRVDKGKQFSAQYTNQTGGKSNIHWHGLIIPAAMDGHPEATIPNGGSFQFTFPVNQRAGTYWYHPHPHGATARQAYMGLAGMFIVQDEEEQQLGLPAGEYELPLILSDKRISADGALQYNPSMEEVMTGFMGETVLVNGVAGPYHEVAPTVYRMRILNASNARIYNLGFGTGSSFTLIGGDGGLLDTPQKVSQVLLSPGERVDLLVDFSQFSQGKAFLRSEPFNEGGQAQGRQAFNLLSFGITKSAGSGFNLPTTLSTLTPLPAATNTRTFTLDMMETMAGHGSMGSMGMHRINQKVYDPARVDEVVKKGDTEVWVFDNSKGDEPHPMHLHGVQFRVIGRTGQRGVQPHERGWKDTVLVAPGEIVKIQMTFADHAGRFVVHCHNLEHEDDGMMLQFEIK
ncbi:multicopper oxidase family protein [Telluribacter humicola]